MTCVYWNWDIYIIITSGKTFCAKMIDMYIVMANTTNTHKQDVAGEMGNFISGTIEI